MTNSPFDIQDNCKILLKHIKIIITSKYMEDYLVKYLIGIKLLLENIQINKKLTLFLISQVI